MITNISLDEYIWYACYGSNLSEQRFLCYIEGGTPTWSTSGKPNKGCADKTRPRENGPFPIKHQLYFAKESSNWDNAGVAFIYPEETQDKEKWTLGRIWLVTKEQFDEIWTQEGRKPNWYGNVISLGKVDGIEVKTITNPIKLPDNRPHDNYLKTIKLGLKETYPELTDEEIEVYLKVRYS